MLSSLKFSKKIMFYDEEGVGNRIGTRPIPRKKKHKNRLRRKKKKKKKKPLPELCIDTNKCTHLNFLLNQGKITHRAPPMVTYTAPIIKTAEPTFDLSKSSDETDVDYEKRLDTILKLKQPQLMMYYEAFKNKNNTDIGEAPGILVGGASPQSLATETTQKRKAGRPPKSYGKKRKEKIEKERLEQLGLQPEPTMAEHFSGDGPRIPRAPSEPREDSAIPSPRRTVEKSDKL